MCSGCESAAVSLTPHAQLVCVAATLSRQVWDEVVKPMMPVKMGRIATEGLHRPTAGVIQVRASCISPQPHAPRC
jgi:hypothetical protein